MNEVVMKTLTCPLLVLAKAEEKGAPVTNPLNYAHSTSRRELYAPNYVKKKNIAFSNFFFDTLSSSLRYFQHRLELC